ncbi:unnamed protein product [Gadus morhua 'NCC']
MPRTTCCSLGGESLHRPFPHPGVGTPEPHSGAELQPGSAFHRGDGSQITSTDDNVTRPSPLHLPAARGSLYARETGGLGAPCCFVAEWEQSGNIGVNRLSDS